MNKYPTITIVIIQIYNYNYLMLSTCIEYSTTKSLKLVIITTYACICTIIFLPNSFFTNYE